MLRHRADLRSLAFVAIEAALIALAMSTELSFVVAALVFTAICIGFFSAAISAHNAMHAPIFHSRALNRVWQAILSVAMGHPVSAFVPAHNASHHRHLQTTRDVLRTTEVRYTHNGLNLLSYTMRTARHMLATDVAYYKAMARKRSPWFGQLCVEIAAVVLFFAVMLWIDWQRALVFVVVPSQIGLRMIVSLGYPQHDGTDPTSRFNHSRNFTGALFNFIAFNNGFHGVHHARPGLHWSEAPRAHAETFVPHVHPALDQPSMLRFYFVAYVWPAHRVRFDGAPIVLPPSARSEVIVESTPDTGAVAV